MHCLVLCQKFVVVQVIGSAVALACSYVMTSLRGQGIFLCAVSPIHAIVVFSPFSAFSTLPAYTVAVLYTCAHIGCLHIYIYISILIGSTVVEVDLNVAARDQWSILHCLHIQFQTGCCRGMGVAYCFR